MENQQHRNYCFTLNNYTPDDIGVIQALECTYMVYGEEIGEQGTPHLQGYVEFKSPKRFSTIRKILGGRIHWEPRKGSAQQADTYCKKDGKVWTKGQISQQGRRTDLEGLAKKVLTGQPMNELVQENPEMFVRYSKGLQLLRTFSYVDRTEAPQVYWRWGKTGVGKTRYPVEKHPSHYIKDGTMWWDGYTQQEAIIIDDFDGKWPYRDLLRLLDRYVYQGQVKGGYVKINSPFIYITSEHPPSYFWADNELAQIMRRLTACDEIGVINLDDL